MSTKHLHIISKRLLHVQNSLIFGYSYTSIYVTCPNEMSRMSKKLKIELVTPLERRCINLSNGVKIMDISHTQPKLLDAEHA